MVRGRSGLGIAALTSEDVSSKKEFRQLCVKKGWLNLAFEDPRFWDILQMEDRGGDNENQACFYQ